MPLLGQASGGWTESSSALRLLNVGIRNSIGVLTDDSFTQANPPSVTTAGTISTRVNTTKSGVLSGSVAFARHDAGENFVGGPVTDAVIATLSVKDKHGFKALGVFINSANGNPYENTPGVASGVGPYVCAMGTYGNALYETQVIAGPNDPTIGSAISYAAGQRLISSKNGYLMPRYNVNNAGSDFVDLDLVATAAEAAVSAGLFGGGAGTSTVIGVLKMAPDAVQTELVYDQRI